MTDVNQLSYPYDELRYFQDRVLTATTRNGTEWITIKDLLNLLQHYSTQGVRTGLFESGCFGAASVRAFEELQPQGCALSQGSLLSTTNFGGGRINQALADALASPRNAGRPTLLDLRQKIAERMYVDSPWINRPLQYGPILTDLPGYFSTTGYASQCSQTLRLRGTMMAALN
jgi:hypothetical protein